MATVSIFSAKPKQDMFLYVYIFFMCLYIFHSADVLWIERFPTSVLCLLAIMVSLVKIVQLKDSITSQQFIICFCFFLFYFLSFFIWNWGAKFFYLLILAHLLSTISVVILPISEKKILLKAISNMMTLIIIISVPVWLLFVAGFDLPHSDVIFHENGFHQYYDYYFFRLGARNDDVLDMILPRFSSFFLEPGQLATPCVFLFYLNGAKLNWRNLPFLIAILLSFSLVGLVLLFGCFIARKIIEGGKSVFFQLFLSFVGLVGILFYFSQYVDEENPVNEFVVSRLEYDEDKGIAGNNRTSATFDRKFEHVMQSSGKYMGIHDRLREGSDWTYNCSGYKKFIVHHGLVGFVGFMICIILLMFYNRNVPSLFFFILVTLAFFVRDLLQSPLWISIAIIGFSLLGNQSGCKLFLKKTVGAN